MRISGVATFYCMTAAGLLWLPLVAQSQPPATRSGSDNGGYLSYLPVPALASGYYTVAWRAVGADTHVVSGEINFAVGAS